LKGAILAREGKNDEAVALVEQVLRDVSPVPSDARLLLAGLQANRKDWAKALATIDLGLKDDPRHSGLLQAAVEIAASNPNDAAITSQAAGFYKRAVQASPKNHELWLAWARYHQSRQETDLAESVMREAVKSQPDDGKRRLALADFLLATRGAAVAEQQYLSSINERPRDMALRFGLANLYRGSNRPLEA
jgi:thioredoxin-like negative regulator of GroEL